MSAVNYPECLRRLLVHEGGYTNDAADPGGPTNYGITIYDYRKYVKPGATAADVKAMKLADAKAIYKAKYWDAMNCDELPSGVDYAVFDYGVNSGVSRALKVLAKFTGKSPIDTVEAICAERLAFLKRLKTWPVFGAGWGRRVKEVRTYALALASRIEPEKPKAPPDVAPIPAPKTKPLSKSKTFWASIVAAITTAGSQLFDILSDWRVWSAIVVLALLAYIAWERNGKPDIRGFFR